MSNQPFYLTHNDIEYKRLNWRMWFRDNQRVNDIGLVTQLEKAYSDAQRQHKSEPRPLPIVATPHAPVVRKALHKTPREPRRNGRVE